MSAPSFDSSNGGRRVFCWAPAPAARRPQLSINICVRRRSANADSVMLRTRLNLDLSIVWSVQAQTEWHNHGRNASSFYAWITMYTASKKHGKMPEYKSRKIAVLCAVNLARNSVIVARSPFVRACGMVTSSYLNHIMSDWLDRFYRATLCMCRPSFCLFVASRCSIETDERIEMVFTRDAALFSTCCRRVSVRLSVATSHGIVSKRPGS